MNKTSQERLPLVRALFESAKIDHKDIELRLSTDDNIDSFELSTAKESSIFNGIAVEVSFIDSDGVPVLASLFKDQFDMPFEIDIFKGDHTTVRDWPTEDDLSGSN